MPIDFNHFTLASVLLSYSKKPGRKTLLENYGENFMLSQRKTNRLLLLILPILALQFGCGKNTPVVSSSALTNPNGIQLSLTTTNGSLTVAPGSTLQFTASGGTAPYTYSILSPASPTGGVIVAATGAYTAPASSMAVQISVQDSVGALGYAMVTVTTSTTTTTGTQVTLCTTSSNCQSTLGLVRELNAQNPYSAYNNALGACVSKGKALVSYQTSQESISCGMMYGLEDWNGGSFVWTQYPICSLGYVNVVSQIVCQ